MAFCKICVCGEKIVFERRMSYPDTCPKCGRRTMDYPTYNENDPRVEEAVRALDTSKEDGNGVNPTSTDALCGRGSKRYALRLCDGSEIEIPEEGCIIGRDEVGADVLARFPSVSRKHIRVTVKRSIGVIIEDVSSYGTLVDGQRLSKRCPVRVAEGAKITLCDVETTLISKEDNR